MALVDHLVEPVEQVHRVSFFPRPQQAPSLPADVGERSDLTDESFDVAIIGGGIIGVSAAALLAKEGVRVGLFERESKSRRQRQVATRAPSSIRSIHTWLRSIARRSRSTASSPARAAPISSCRRDPQVSFC